MNKIFVTGDTHGFQDVNQLTDKNFIEGKSLTKNDYLIVAGDFGMIFAPENNPYIKIEERNIDFLNNRPWTTLFVDGNHENFDRLNGLEQVDMFGDKVGKVSNSIFHLRRGKVYTIGGKKIFTFGGGESIDKFRRTSGVSWWKEEMPTKKEMDEGMDILKKYNNEVDYIITHTCPKFIFDKISDKFNMMTKICAEESLRKFFDIIGEETKFNKWYFGNFHIKYKFKKYQCLYKDIEKIN